MSSNYKELKSLSSNRFWIKPALTQWPRIHFKPELLHDSTQEWHDQPNVLMEHILELNQAIKDNGFSESLFMIRNRHRIWPSTDLLTPVQT